MNSVKEWELGEILFIYFIILFYFIFIFAHQPTNIYIYIYISAVKRLIASKISFCLHNKCVCTVYIYYVNIKTHTYSLYFENIYMYIFIVI